MAKNLKINIKNTQIAQAINLGGLKEKLAKKKSEKDVQTEEATPKKKGSAAAPKVEPEIQEAPKEEAPRIKARSKSAFTEKGEKKGEAVPTSAVTEEPVVEQPSDRQSERLAERQEEFSTPKKKAESLFKEEFESAGEPPTVEPLPTPVIPEKQEAKEATVHPYLQENRVFSAPKNGQPSTGQQRPEETKKAPEVVPESRVKLGPTGQHIKDLLPPKPAPKPRETFASPPPRFPSKETPASQADKAKLKPKEATPPTKEEEEEFRKGKQPPKVKEFRDLKPLRKQAQPAFDARDRHGLRTGEDETHYKKRRPKSRPILQEETTIRPTQLKIRIPITVKDLASEMKLKSSEIISKLFLNGMIVSINDRLDDETTIQLIGQELGCEITIDTSEEERIRITDKTIQEEIKGHAEDDVIARAPIVAFMGHVDHGKTSLIDAIRKSKRAAGEAGAITQHIGAFRCHTPVGDIAILDTPGHEAFSAMRARGANVTDIVVLVVAGDEGLRQQTLEAIQHAREAKNTIVVAINKSDKPGFNAEQVYRQLSEQELLPEVWGGTTLTINCSAVTGEGIEQLLEMLALQAEVLELKANVNTRARGTVLESEMHKGLGAVATVLVQNGTLKKGDALVCDHFWGRIKTMHDEFGKDLETAGPSTPVAITGLSGLPEAGEEFVIVKNDKEARSIAEARQQGEKQRTLQLTPRFSAESIFQKASESAGKKIFNIILRADVQGSLEAIKVALQKIESKKVDLNIVFAGVGEISESDVQLAATSKSTIIGFHTKIESHAEMLIKELSVQAKLHDIIYHAIDDVKVLMAAILDKIPQENLQGRAEVKATFKSSHHGVIAGCMVIEGIVHRNDTIRLKRANQEIWKGSMSSLKRVKDDVREVQKGIECGILLKGFNDAQTGDIFEAFEIVYITQEL